MPAPTVFISYSHQDEAWIKRLLPHLRALETAGVGMQVWHDRRIDGGDKWYPEIQDAMANAAAAILLISSDFLASPFCVFEEVPALLKRQEETSMLLIPVLLRQCAWRAHRWLKDRQMIPRDGKCVAIDFADDHSDAVFAAVAEQVLAHFEQFAVRRAAVDVVLESVQLITKGTVGPDPNIIPTILMVPWPVLSVECIDLTRLPETGSALFGRNEELALLDQAWSAPEKVGAPSVRVLAFTAHGGVGKSTLVNHWLAEMSLEHYRGATRVFGWSFYSQGVRGGAAASTDAFIETALRFFGDSNPTARSPSDNDELTPQESKRMAELRGERLARLIGVERTLLVLDGLEPFQSADVFERGKLRDPALESLLRGLARQSAGLCLITTREPLADLAQQPSVATRDLEQIDPQAGRALLRTLRIVGTDAELESLARRFGPHALAVSLLGVYLREQPDHGIGPARAIEQLPGTAPIDRVLAGFEQWMGDSPEREALRLLGLFDRPVDAGCLRALRMAPVIPGLTERLVGLGDAEWDQVLGRLEKLRLIQVHYDRSDQGAVLDAHPLIREYFAELLKVGDTWRAAHRRLYEHLCATTKEGDQPTLEQLQPLYQAVAHGCQAGMQQEAVKKVFHDRIERGNEHYSIRKLGAFGSDLGAIACFFEPPWNRVSPALTEAAQGWLLSKAAFSLRAVGRLTEALDPMRAGLAMGVKAEDWKESALRACNLSELELALGEVATAVGDAKQSVTYADRSGSEDTRMIVRARFADTLHQAGRWAEAEAHFREAEALQAESNPYHSFLYSMRGFQYCDLLLAEAEREVWRQCLSIRAQLSIRVSLESCRAVSERATTIQKRRTGQPNYSLLDIGLDQLTFGRATLYAAIFAKSEFRSSRSEIDLAVDGLRRAGEHIWLTAGLLTRAWLRSLTGARTGPESAQSDLDDAWEIAERGPMPLHMADIHLHRARLFFRDANYPWESPQKDLAEARRLIEKCGYWRRKEELEDAELAILGKPAR